MFRHIFHLFLKKGHNFSKSHGLFTAREISEFSQVPSTGEGGERRYADLKFAPGNFQGGGLRKDMKHVNKTAIQLSWVNRSQTEVCQYLNKDYISTSVSATYQLCKGK